MKIGKLSLSLAVSFCLYGCRVEFPVSLSDIRTLNISCELSSIIAVNNLMLPGKKEKIFAYYKRHLDNKEKLSEIMTYGWGEINYTERFYGDDPEMEEEVLEDVASGGRNQTKKIIIKKIHLRTKSDLAEMVLLHLKKNPNFFVETCLQRKKAINEESVCNFSTIQHTLVPSFFFPREVVVHNFEFKYKFNDKGEIQYNIIAIHESILARSIGNDVPEKERDLCRVEILKNEDEFIERNIINNLIRQK